jgi:hypothetical protein
MPNYSCLRCGFETNIKYNYIRHINRKRVCKPIINDISIECIRNYFNKKNETSKVIIKRSISKNIKCEICNKLFNTRQAKYKHKLKCKQEQTINELENTKLNNIIKKKDKQLTQMTTHVNKLNKILNRICDFNSFSKSNKITNNTDNRKTQINNTLTNNTQNNNHQQVKINNFGEEDISYITAEKKKNLLIDPRNSITKLIDDTHFNSDHPENANVRIPNKKQPFIELYVDNSWKIFNQYKTICNILRDKKDFIHNIFINRQNELTKKEKDNYLDYKERIDRDLFLVKNVLTDIRASIMSGTRYQTTDSIINLLNIKKETDPTQKLLNQIPESFLYENDSSDDDENFMRFKKK